MNSTADEQYQQPVQYDHYRDWLVARLGRPMERALIRAEQRYTKLKPAHMRTSQLHIAYRKRRR